MDVRTIQENLQALGFSPGDIDGVWGRRTRRAVVAFQTAQGLAPDGIVGDATLAALFGAAPTVSVGETIGLPWYQEGLRLMGVREIAGRGSNPTILQWADDLDLHYPDDDVPWCGLYVAHCVGSTLTDEDLPPNPLGARNWTRFGRATAPTLGAVLVFWRGSPGGAQGHVGFYNGEDASAYHVLGGNQSNKVSVARIARGRLIGARWPSTAPAVPLALVQKTATGALAGSRDQA